MSYLVFARKWRPLKFDDVVGQDHVTRTLKLAIEKNRVAHAYIFTGTRGVGKTTTARILARALNCRKGPTPDPCGECDSCKSILHGSSFDVLEIDGASNNSVDDIRELRENINYSSMGGKYRIYVIDEVHMLSKPAFNALLKTLEEPPKNVIFIFATTEPYKIPETIHSRCQRYDFRRISTEKILEQLKHICSSEGIEFEDDGLLLIARKADGSMRDALSLLDQAYSFCQGKLLEKDVRSVLGIVDSHIYETIVGAISEKKPQDIIGSVEDVLYGGFDLHEFIIGLEEYIRNMLFSKIPNIAKNSGAPLSADGRGVFAEQASRFSEVDLLRMTEILYKAEHDLKWNAYPRFLVENTLLKLMYLDSSVSMEQLLESLNRGTRPTPDFSYTERAEKQQDTKDIYKKKETNSDNHPASPGDTEENSSSTTNYKSTSSAQPVASIKKEDADTEPFGTKKNKTEPDNLAALWPQFLEFLIKDRPNLGTFLSMAYIASTDDNSIDLRFSPGHSFQFSEVTKKNNRDTIIKKLAKFAGRPVDLHITVEKQTAKTESPKTATYEKTNRLPLSLQDEMEKEPVIKNVIEIFNGEIV